jgi:predicted metal-binding membrane protein
LFQTLLERDRAAVAACLIAVIGLAWWWLWRHTGMEMQPHLPFLLAMWWIMMVAMMLPSAAPMILLFATVSRRQREQGRSYVPTALFAATYIVVWGLFSLAAAALQSRLETASPPAWLSGALLLSAGLYQLTPLKDSCLRQCRSPLNFLMTRWRPGWRGALRMGVEHGAYCVGCCWLLMGLLFVGGVMNLWWVIGIALYVLLEKVVPAGTWLGRALGALLAVAGTLVLLGSVTV